MLDHYRREQGARRIKFRTETPMLWSMRNLRRGSRLRPAFPQLLQCGRTIPARGPHGLCVHSVMKAPNAGTRERAPRPQPLKRDGDTSTGQRCRRLFNWFVARDDVKQRIADLVANCLQRRGYFMTERVAHDGRLPPR